MLVLSHITTQNPADGREKAAMRDVAAIYETTTNPGLGRTSDEFRVFFGDWELAEPGLVYAPAWRPDRQTISVGDPGRSHILAAVARKPDR
jgi:hypothetical protein